ncbi:protein phosphatase 2A regulatory subunit [Trypanosoma theileri]|uniref:Protein phosphatase 2A regulatory subunit n=1 Tax=Trypanosoma theileri TaxID=67003 RepID=A0A1X0P1E7_9TRYP|nr:protein phosphatase 2A regulatory subunit [Trypanosoma theileri]ORC90523.1 protein phosphatase 2A regulatory subunit [Trypanosoma theileri]
MMIPGLNLDSALGRRSTGASGPRVEDGVPGCFSPRPAHSRSASVASSAGPMLEGRRDKERERELESSPAQRRGPSLEGFARSTASPSMPTITRASERRERALRRLSPRATLLNHQHVRQASASLLRACAAPPPPPPLRRATTTTTTTGNSSVNDDSRKVSGGTSLLPIHSEVDDPHVEYCDKLMLREVYVTGKQWRHVPAAQREACRFPSTNISALATSTSGEHVAIGDRCGRVFVMRRGEQMEHEHDDDDVNNDNDHIKRESKNSRRVDNSTVRVHEPYNFAVGRQAYTSVIDPLNSVEVTPSIQALCFLPEAGPTTYVLTANEKMPKLYKVVQVRESPAPFFAVDRLGEKTVGSLTLNPLRGTTTCAMKQVSRYALNHEYNINSLCPLADSAQFFSADELTVKLWCVEYPDTSIETYSLKPPLEEDAQEVICGIRTFQHEPFLLFVLTTSGNVRIVDTRQTLKWLYQTPLVFRNTLSEEDIVISSSLSDCALSPCGRYIAGRDMMSVCLWDIRRTTPYSQTRGLTPSMVGHDDEYDVVRRWELYPHLRQDIEQYFQGEILEQFNVRFLNTHEMCTGGFAGTLYTLDTLKENDSTIELSSGEDSSFSPRCNVGEILQFPEIQGAKDTPHGPLRSLPIEDVTFPISNDSEVLLRGTVTRLSHPFTSANGNCSLLGSCGNALVQLNYSNLCC